MASLRTVLILCLLHLCVHSIEGEVKPAVHDDKLLVQKQQNMAAETKDTVWMGFMDVVPVIGTVKESVELVLAVYEGDEAVIKEKEKAVENILKESLKKNLNKSTSSDKPAADGEFSGLTNVREVRKEMITEHVMKRSKRGKNKGAKGEKITADQNERQRKLDRINDEMLRKIHIINPGFIQNQPLRDNMERSNRGEHVFNNNILKFHSNVLSEFIKKHNINNLQKYDQKKIDALGKHTLDQNIADEIQTNMVVHFDKDEFYVNENGVVYGEYIRALREAILAVLKYINPDEETPEESERVEFVIDHMHENEIYVDELAKVKWIDNNEDKLERFNKVKQEVVNMYNTERVLNWCKEVLRLVAPWFG